MGKRILSDEEARNALKKGIEKIVKVVAETMGAKGCPVILSGGYGTNPKITKDGVTVAAYIMHDDENENIGAMLVRGACAKTVKDAGDGTTATAVLLGALINEGFKQTSSGHSSVSIKKGIEIAVDKVVEYIKANSKDIDHAKLLNIATISANNDIEIGELIAEAYKKIGFKGRLTTEKTNKPETYIETVEGFEFDRGFKDEKFINDPKGRVVFKNPKILVFNYDIGTLKPFEQGLLLELFNSADPVVVIANSVSGELETFMIVNRGKGLKTVAIHSPILYRRESLDDICTITGATLISDDEGIKLESIKMEHVGSCDSIIVEKDSTTILGGHGDVKIIKQREESIKVDIENEDEEEVIEVHRKRLARLTGSVGVIYVGGATEVEIQEKYDRVEDAVKAVESAVIEGVSMGGGVTLMNAAKEVKKLKLPAEEKVGAQIVEKALLSPITQILDNASVNTQLIIGELATKGHKVGYNVKINDYCDMEKSGILDPSKVIRVALENAASVACGILTSKSMVITTIKAVEGN